MDISLSAKLRSIDWKLKTKAFTVHFALSLMIFLLLLYFIIFQWYPAPFFSTDGGIQGLQLIIFVDLVLGPTLTFIVFNHNKPRRLLKLDLAAIALVQVAALGYGISVTYNERPVAIVFSDDTFHPIPYYQFAEAGYSMNELRNFGNKLPVTIYSELPDKKHLDARMNLFLSSYQTHTPLFLMGNLYRRIGPSNINEIATHSINMDDYVMQDFWGEKRQKMQKIYHDFLSTLQRSPTEYLYLAIYARYCQCILVADRTTLDFIDVINIPPPQVTQTEINVN